MNGSTTPYKGRHLVAHALFFENGSHLSTRLLVCMCLTRDAAFNELATIISKNAEFYK